jgi:hypothetical protein
MAKICRDIRRIKREERYERMGAMTREGKRVVSVACSPFGNAVMVKQKIVVV